MKIALLVVPILFLACIDNKKTPKTSRLDLPKTEEVKEQSKMEKYYQQHNQDTIESTSKGSPSKGGIENSSLFPPAGNNYKYFSEESYLKGRGFVNSNVKSVLISAFELLEHNCPDQLFQIMECSHEHGGELWPHRTHQNGTSIDLMLPKSKNGKIDCSLDERGLSHYFLNTDDQGRYIDSEGVAVNFETTAQLVLAINEAAKKKGWKISKVIFKIELKDELFATKSGAEILKEKIYFAQSLPKKVNEFHDDHIHIDFEKIK